MSWELTTEQRKRLPGYVLVYIDHLERRVEEQTHYLAERQESADTNVWTRARSMIQNSDRPLERDTEIRFDLTPSGNHSLARLWERYIDVSHDLHRTDFEAPRLKIIGPSPLIIEPTATNYIYVRLGDR